MRKLECLGLAGIMLVSLVGPGVTVTGSLISVINKRFLLVTEMTGDRTMKPRAAYGRSAWAEGDNWHVH
jgi:hypothetical protein